MIQSRVACTFTGAVVFLLVLTGCQGADPGVAQEPAGSAPASASASATPSVAPTPTPSPASAAGPAVNLPVPEKPALADENSVEGLEAFTEWWFELLNYAYATNDLEPLWAVTDEGCTTCQNIEKSIAGVYESGGWVVGGDISLKSFDSDFELNTARSLSSFIRITQSEATYFDASGEVNNESPGFTEPRVNETIALFENGVWTLLDVGSVNTGTSR